MSSAIGCQFGLAIADYQKLWADSICQVLSKIANTQFHAKAVEGSGAEASDSPLFCALFTFGPPVTGEQAICFSEKDGLKLSHFLVGEPLAEGATFDSEQREAVAELLRQVCGTAALALSSRLKAEVEVNLTGMERPGWLQSAALSGAFQIWSASDPTPLLLNISISPELEEVLRPAEGEPATLTPGLLPSPKSQNLEFLRQVEIPVTLRFGKREMLLREILELAPGAVLELEQRIEEPVELLVGPRLIARGEVVVVEGCYGLRVTELIGTAERLNCLR
jgi:flagellar motor switch protein FliN/FliY